jgi:hypothetical protein
MSLQSILEIVLESLTSEERRGFAVAEEIYKLQKSPTEISQLHETMKLIIGECTKRHLRYGKAFLLRFKQIERGEWPSKAIPFPRKQPVPSDYGVRANPAAMERYWARQRKIGA